MHPLAAACWALAVAAALCGLFYGVLYVRRPVAREHLPFSLLCLAICAYDLFSAGLYGSTSLAEGLGWERLQLVSLALVTIFSVWFLALLSEGRLRPTHWAFIVVLAALIPLVWLNVPGLSVSAQTPDVKSVSWAGHHVISYYESDLGVLNTVGVVVAWLAFAYVVSGVYRAHRRDPSLGLRPVLIGEIVYLLGLVNDGLVASSVYSFFYVSEYAFLVVVLTMSFALLGRLVELYETVESANATLRSDVARLEGLIPVCSWCRRLRNDAGYWQDLEAYLLDHGDVQCTHSICPDCLRSQFGEQENGA